MDWGVQFFTNKGGERMSHARNLYSYGRDDLAYGGRIGVDRCTNSVYVGVGS